MPRSARIVDPEGFYHVVARGNNRQAVFHDMGDHRAFKRQLAECRREHGLQLFHYALMTNHYHLVVRAGRGVSLALIFKSLMQGYACYHKKKYGYVGRLWQDRFHSKPIETDAHLLMCGVYVELNPVRASMVTAPGAYPWSSHRHYALGESDSLVDDNPAFLALSDDAGERRIRYRKIVDAWID